MTFLAGAELDPTIFRTKWREALNYRARGLLRASRKLELLVNSYADAYRLQIHRINETSGATADPGQLQADLELVKSWQPASAAD